MRHIQKFQTKLPFPNRNRKLKHCVRCLFKIYTPVLPYYYGSIIILLRWRKWSLTVHELPNYNPLSAACALAIGRNVA